MHVANGAVVSSGVAWGGQRRGEREMKTVYSGDGHGGVVLALLLGSWTFFDEIVNGIQFLSVVKIGRDTNFLVGISMSYGFVILVLL